MNKAEPFRLLDLPAEIRRMILRDLLCQDEPIFFQNLTPKHRSGTSRVRRLLRSQTQTMTQELTKSKTLPGSLGNLQAS